MTDAHYVYVVTEVMSAPSTFGNLTWRQGNQSDQVARRAFQSVIVLQSVDETSSDITTQVTKKELAIEFRRRS
ncbi:hypothetical protein BV898_14681 [Hypsibius exemplaris]|uniref:Uncharacterized protein n=1 Tax=Hypsibius exemplaris TaxID=2072580 RepID=A0A9X6NGB3_HYPEX|nr:hypothetical protein BV898_14681 [Hypsibius exemplaris]